MDNPPNFIDNDITYDYDTEEVNREQEKNEHQDNLDRWFT